MQKFVLAAISSAAMLAFAVGVQANPKAETVAAKAPETIAAAVADTTRPADARARDADRKPAAVLKFSGVKAGDTVVELVPGGGYYTALLSRVVGPQGKIYAVDPERIFEKFPNARNGFTKYIESDPRENVDYTAQNLDALTVPEKADQVWMVLYYHDTVWTGEDRAKMNKAIYDELKPGGVYFIVDHIALAGAGDEVTSDLHRIDPAVVKSEVEAAGFKLAGESDVLSHPEDTHDTSVFAEGVRGKTDRFVWKYVKPE